MRARTPEQIRNDIIENAVLSDCALTDGQKGAMVGALNHAVGDDRNRHILLGWLFGMKDSFKPKSSKTLSDGEWCALYDWADFWYDEEDAKWRPSARFPVEAVACLSVAIKDQSLIPVSERGDERPPEIIGTAVSFLDGHITALIDEDGDANVPPPEEVERSEYWRKEETKVDKIIGGKRDVNF